jgi:hypothetical protein
MLRPAHRLQPGDVFAKTDLTYSVDLKTGRRMPCADTRSGKILTVTIGKGTMGDEMLVKITYQPIVGGALIETSRPQTLAFSKHEMVLLFAD